MRQFIKNLPMYNGEVTEELVEIALHHFMAGQKMYFDGGYEITTQAGFANAVIDNYKWTRRKIQKIIDTFNKEYISPDAYRELKYNIRYNIK